MAWRVGAKKPSQGRGSAVAHKQKQAAAVCCWLRRKRPECASKLHLAAEFRKLLLGIHHFAEEEVWRFVCSTTLHTLPPYPATQQPWTRNLTIPTLCTCGSSDLNADMYVVNYIPSNLFSPEYYIISIHIMICFTAGQAAFRVRKRRWYSETISRLSNISSDNKIHTFVLF